MIPTRLTADMEKDADGGRTGNCLDDQLQQFPGETVQGKQHSSNVTAWTRKALDQSRANWVAECRRHNRNAGGYLPGLHRGGDDAGHDDVRFEMHQVLNKRWHACDIAVRVSIVNV